MRKIVAFLLIIGLFFSNIFDIFALTSVPINANLNLNTNLENVFLTDL